MHRGQAEAALFETLVREDEASAVPGENLEPVAATRREDEERPGEQVLLPFAAYDGAEPVDAFSEVDGSSGEENSDRWREQKQRLTREPQSAPPTVEAPSGCRSG
jgi:hypothetical protein